MRVAHLLLVATLVLATTARAQEEDDDPKAKPPAAVKQPKPDKKQLDGDAKPKAKTDAKLDGDAAKPKAKADAKVDGDASRPKAKADAKLDGDAAKPKAKTDADKPLVKKAAVDKAVDKSADKADKPADDKLDEAPPIAKKKLPKLARATEPVAPVEPPPADPLAAPRSVRVRLVDGSTVVGSVRAEQADALVVDCSLGQLSIPRSRISTIAYDAAACVGTKHAPVQQLDDDAPPKKR